MPSWHRPPLVRTADQRLRLLSRRLAFLIASTSSSLVIDDRPLISSRLATSSRCFLLAFASTPSALLPLAFGPPLRARESDGPLEPLGSQWSPTFSKLCLSAL